MNAPSIRDHDQTDERLSQVAESFVEEYRQGQQPSIEQYAARYPDLAGRLRQLLPTLMVVEELGPNDSVGKGAWDSSMESVVPPYIGDYRILREIGRGGMGVVYEAEQISLGRTVALKLLGQHRALNPKLIDRFKSEARSSARLHHPRIIPVYDVGMADGFHFYAMQLIDGVGLDQVLADLQATSRMGDADALSRSAANVDTVHQQAICSGNNSDPAIHPLRPENSDYPTEVLSNTRNDGRHYYREVARLAMHVAESLGYAHSQGILHRDIKPSNLILDRRGEVWVADFGLAKAFDGILQDGQDSLTETGDIVGTMRYMAPERFRGWSDPRSDIYGLGITLYELLTTQPAFDAKDRVVLMEQVQKVTPRSPRTVDRRIPRDLETIVLTAIDKEPGRRYLTADEFAADLRSFLELRPIRARRASFIAVARQWCRRNPITTSLVGVLACVVLGAWIAIYGLWQRALAANQEATSQLAISQSINEFLQVDLLSQSDIANQSVVTDRNRNITVRELLDRAARKISGKFDQQPRTEAAILKTLGKSYQALGEYNEALKHLDRSLSLLQKTLGSTHPDTLQSMSDLAGLHDWRSEYDEAERLYRQVLDFRRNKLGSDHLDTLQSVNDLGVLLADCGRYEEAEPLLTTAMEQRRDKLGIDHLDTLESLYEVASLYTELGKYAEADRLHKQALEGRRARLGNDHPLTIHSIIALGANYLDWQMYDTTRGNHEEAELLFKQAVELTSVSLGSDHPETLRAMNSLATLYVYNDQYDQAQELLQQVLEGWKTKLGSQHSDTLIAMNNLAALHARRGQHEEAIGLFEQVLKAQQSMLDPNHVDVLITSMNLAGSYRDTQRYEQAEVLFTDAIARAKRTLGFSHVFTQTVIPNLAELHSLQGKPEATEPLLREIADFHRQHSGQESQVYDDQLAFLFRNLIRQEKFHDAEEIARERLAIRVKNVPDAWALFMMKSQVGEALLGQRNFVEAEPLLLEGYEGMRARKDQMGSSAPSRLAAAREKLIQLYDSWGKPDEAARWRADLVSP